MFYILSQTNFAIWITFNLLSANAFNLDRSLVLSFGKGLHPLPQNCQVEHFEETKFFILLHRFQFINGVYPVICKCVLKSVEFCPLIELERMLLLGIFQ